MADAMEERLAQLEASSTSHKMALDVMFLLVCAVFVFGELYDVLYAVLLQNYLTNMNSCE